ncbi:acyltransferase family protein [Paenibacillus sp. GCM10023252]|uniref:acyltransferase family protein n=1 Tax=Paenibacillus sp. GCM10023252 TaxID=3252649 RepID=UPI003622CF24
MKKQPNPAASSAASGVHASPAASGGNRARILGLDLARLLAIVGMVIVHAATDLVMLPQERLQPEADVPWPTSPEWAYWFQVLFANRARPLFILLAGVGISLLVTRKGIRRRELVLRAIYLALLGILLVAAGWSDIVLCLYGIMFLLSTLLLRASQPVLLILAALLLAAPLPFVEAGATQQSAETALNIMIVLSQTAYFILGMSIGRLRLGERSATCTLWLAGAVLAVPGLAHLQYWTGSIQVMDVTSWLDFAAAQFSTAGCCLLALAACLTLGRSEGSLTQRMLRPLAVTGGMSLTVYVAHALLYTYLSHYVTFQLQQAMLVSFSYLIAAILLTNLWRALGRQGPLEQLMRFVSQPKKRREESSS